MDRGRAGGYVLQSNHVQMNLIKKKRRVHLERIRKIMNREPGSSETLDNNPPVIVKAALTNPRKKALKDEFAVVTQRENKMILKRITTILTAPPKITDEEYQKMRSLVPSMRGGYRELYEHNLIEQRNKNFYKHLKTMGPYYKVKEWENDYKRQFFHQQKFMRQVLYKRPAGFVDPLNPSTDEKEESNNDMNDSKMDESSEDFNYLMELTEPKQKPQPSSSAPMMSKSKSTSSHINRVRLQKNNDSSPSSFDNRHLPPIQSSSNRGGHNILSKSFDENKIRREKSLFSSTISSKSESFHPNESRTSLGNKSKQKENNKMNPKESHIIHEGQGPSVEEGGGDAKDNYRDNYSIWEDEGSEFSSSSANERIELASVQKYIRVTESLSNSQTSSIFNDKNPLNRSSSLETLPERKRLATISNVTSFSEDVKGPMVPLSPSADLLSTGGYSEKWYDESMYTIQNDHNPTTTTSDHLLQGVEVIALPVKNEYCSHADLQCWLSHDSQSIIISVITLEQGRMLEAEAEIMLHDLSLLRGQPLLTEPSQEQVNGKVVDMKPVISKEELNGLKLMALEVVNNIEVRVEEGAARLILNLVNGPDDIEADNAVIKVDSELKVSDTIPKLSSVNQSPSSHPESGVETDHSPPKEVKTTAAISIAPIEHHRILSSSTLNINSHEATPRKPSVDPRQMSDIQAMLLADPQSKLLTAGRRLQIIFHANPADQVTSITQLIHIAKITSKVEFLYTIVKICSTAEDQLFVSVTVMHNSSTNFKKGTKIRPAVPEGPSLTATFALPSLLQADPEMIESFVDNLSRNLQIEHDCKTGDNRLILIC